MSMTQPTFHAPHTRVSVPSWVRRHLSWMLVVLAVVATAAVLAVTLIDSDSNTDIAPVTQTFDADRGSISAIDHSTGTAGGTSTVAEQGSISAVEHSTESSTTGSLQDESISAIDHRLSTQDG